MIKSIEINELGLKNRILIIEFENNTVKELKNGIMLPPRKFSINSNLIMEHIFNNVLHWDKYNTDNRNIIDNDKLTLRIETDDEVLEYSFIGKTPDNYTSFVKELEKMVNN